MNIVNMPIEKLKVYKKTLRNNQKSVEYVANSIRKYGVQQPIVIDENNVIVAGASAYLAAKELGMTEFPCVKADDLSEEQIKRYRIADNKTAEISRWDYLGLAKEIKTISGNDLLDIGFNGREVDLLKGLDLDLESQGQRESAESSSSMGGVYKPNYTPTFSTYEETEADVRAAEMHEETRFMPKPQFTRVYVCPKCGKKFEAK